MDWIPAYDQQSDEVDSSLDSEESDEFINQIYESQYITRRHPIILIFAAVPRPQIERLTGVVDAMRGGVAYLTVTDEKGHEIEIEWGADDLRAKSIEEGHYFHLTTRKTDGKDMEFEFRPVGPKPLTEESRREIEDLLSRYRDRGLLDDVEP
jgi:hypothetical protein